MVTDQKTRRRRRVRGVVLGGVLGLVALCLGALAVFAAINARLPQALDEPQRFTAEQAALVEEAAHLKRSLGDQVWPGFGQARIPLLSWNDVYAFVCLHPQPPAGWELLEQVQVGGQPCYRAPWADGQNFAVRIGDQWAGSLVSRAWGLITLRQQLAELLPAPVRPVAPVFLLTNAMLRPYRYVGGQLHESFHAYQAIAMPQRFADAELAYPAGARYWALDAQMRPAWEAEIDALYAAVAAGEQAQARDLARQFLALRGDRRAQSLASQDLVLYEQRLEWLEGMAKYVELHMLRAANAAAAAGSYQPAAVLENSSLVDYSAAERFFGQELSQMKRQAGTEGDTRFYYTGLAQAVLLDRWRAGWQARVGEPGVWIEDLLREALAEE